MVCVILREYGNSYSVYHQGIKGFHLFKTENTIGNIRLICMQNRIPDAVVHPMTTAYPQEESAALS